MNKINKTQFIAYTAIITGITALCTAIISIPIGLAGYINFGDSIIFIAGIFFGPFPALIAGGIGAAAADLILGYTIWAPFSFIIKGLEGFFVGFFSIFISKHFKNKYKIVAYIIAMVIAGIVMIAGYFFATWILYGLPIAIISIGQNSIQIGISIAVALGLLGIVKSVIHISKKNTN